MAEATTLETPVTEAVDTRAVVAPDAAAAESVDVVESPASQEPPVFETYAEYEAYEAQSSAKAEGDKAPESKTPARTGPLADPRAAERLAAVRTRQHERQQGYESELKTALATYGIEGPAADLMVNIGKGKINEAYSDSLQNAHVDSAAKAAQDVVDDLRASMRVGLSAAKARQLDSTIQEMINSGNAPFTAALEAREALKYDGWVSPADVRKAKEASFEAGKRWKQNADGTRDDSNRANGRVNGSNSGGSFHSTRDNDTAFNDGRITREQWKANDDRLKAKGT